MRKNISIPDDVDFDLLIKEAAARLWSEDYTVARYPERERYSTSAVIIAALMRAAGRKADELPTSSSSSDTP